MKKVDRQCPISGNLVMAKKILKNFPSIDNRGARHTIWKMDN